MTFIFTPSPKFQVFVGGSVWSEEISSKDQIFSLKKNYAKTALEYSLHSTRTKVKINISKARFY